MCQLFSEPFLRLWSWRGWGDKQFLSPAASLADTRANQAAYPQPSHERPGLGFPSARLVVVFSLAVGTVLDAALGPFAGERTGVPAPFRALHERVDVGDVVLADRYYCSYFAIALLQQRGVDVVMRLHQRRPVDFRRVGGWARKTR
jgi:hypothetical protein